MVEALELQDDADLGSITVSSLTASVTVANTVTLTGDLNGADLVIAGVSGTPVLNVTSAGTIGSLDFGNNAAKVIISATQYAGLSSISNLTGSQTVEIVDATADGSSLATVTQIADIEAYEINPNGADDDITFNLIAAGASVDLTRKGSTDATVIVTAGQAASFDGTWASFAAADLFNVTAAGTVNVESVNSGANMGGLATIDVAGGSTFVAKAVQVASASMTGTGIVTVKNLEGDLDANLSGLASDLNVTAELSSTGDVEFLAAANLTNVDTIQITGTGTVTANASATLGAGTFDVGNGSTLSLTAAQANGLSVTGSGTGAAIVTGLGATTNLSGFALATTVRLDGNVTFSGSFNATGSITFDTTIEDLARTIDLTGVSGTMPSSITLDDDVTLTLTASQAHGLTVDGAGSVIVTGVDFATDLSLVDPSGGVTATLADGTDISGNLFLGTVDQFTLDAGASVTMTIAQQAKISAASGTNTVTIADVGSISAVASVENYVLADAPGGSSNIFTGANAAQVVTGGTGDDAITGGTGNDILYGGAGNDVLTGGSGDDFLIGGAGNDELAGGGGVDTFVYRSGDTALADTKNFITGFVTGVDKLDFGNNVDEITIVNGAGYADINAFTTAADTAFDGGGKDVFISYNQTGYGFGLVAVDMDENGFFDNGDVLIQLLGVNAVGTIAAGDITSNNLFTGVSGTLDAFVFETTATENGLDTVRNFETADNDVLDFSAFDMDGTGDETPALGGDLTVVFTVDPGASVAAAGKVNFLVDIAGGQDITDAAGLQAALAGSGEYASIDMAGDAKALFVTAASSNAGETANVFYATSDSGGAITIEKVAVVSNIDIDDLTSAHFVI